MLFAGREHHAVAGDHPGVGETPAPPAATSASRAAQVMVRPDAASDRAVLLRLQRRRPAQRARRRWTPSAESRTSDAICAVAWRDAATAVPSRRRQVGPQPPAPASAPRTCVRRSQLAGRGRGRDRRGRERPARSRPTRRRPPSSTSTTPSCRAPRSSTWPAGCTSASSSPPATSSAPPGSRPTSALVGVEDPEHVADARASALSFIAGHTVAELEDARRGDLRRDAWPTGSGPAPAPWPSCTSTRASGSGW